MPVVRIRKNYFEDYDLDVEVEICVTITEKYKGDRFCPPTLEWEVEEVHVIADEDADPEKVKSLEADILEAAKHGEYSDDIADACHDYDPSEEYDRFDDYYDR